MTVHPRQRVRLSKLLSLVLRHDPAKAGVELDRAGWADLDQVLAGINDLGPNLDRDGLAEIMDPGDKPRFELSADGTRIRARYGHSVDVDPGYDPVEPPDVLYHGTAERNVQRILAEGISAMSRQMVHLSADEATAVQVGRRHGRPVTLQVDAARLAAADHPFYRLPGGIWLTDEVPAEYVTHADRP